jgi:LuxR family maltose regulon positive regulatory protein
VNSLIPDLIIPSKIQPPPLRVDRILRSQLLAHIGDPRPGQITLVSAPAGFGKTTLISAWLDDCKLPVAWLALDKSDNQLNHFFAYLLAALQKANLNIGKSLDDFLHQDNNDNLESILTQLLSELDNAAPAIVLVLDDYHTIKNPAIHKAVLFLLDHLTTHNPDEDDIQQIGCHPVIISRVDPSFPLSHWRLCGRINEIRVNDLRLSDTDATDLLHRMTNIDLSEDEASALASHSEGWIAGLQLTALSLRGQNHLSIHRFIDEFNGNQRLISDYLFEEVLSQESEFIQSFLMQTSILDQFTGSLCDAITGRTDGQATLEILERSNLFVIPLDHKREWYRYHQLFIDVLTKRREDLGIEKLHELHVKAAVWFENNGFLENSLKHYLAADQIDKAVQVLTRIAPRLLSLSQPLLLIDMVDSFPEKEFNRWPWLCVYRAWTKIINYPESIENWLTLAENSIGNNTLTAAIDPAEKGEILGNIATLRALKAARMGANKETLEYA